MESLATGNVIAFERMKDVSGWSLTEVGQYVKDNNWKGFVLHWDTDDDKVSIERTT